MELLQGDCLELMKGIPDKSIDMVLCDLPYGTTSNTWDKCIDLKQLFSGYGRIVRKGGVIALFSQMPFSVDLINADRKHFRYEWIWQKSQGTGFLNAHKMPLKCHENILIFYDRLPTYHPQFTRGKPYYENCKTGSSNYRELQKHIRTNSSGRRFPLDVIKFAGVNNSAERKWHPTQKPVDLLEYLIRTYTDEGETVLDNCMGSGSTGVACVNTGRDFIGMELDGHYFEIARQRIEEALTRQPDQTTFPGDGTTFSGDQTTF